MKERVKLCRHHEFYVVTGTKSTSSTASGPPSPRGEGLKEVRVLHQQKATELRRNPRSLHLIRAATPPTFPSRGRLEGSARFAPAKGDRVAPATLLPRGKAQCLCKIKVYAIIFVALLLATLPSPRGEGGCEHREQTDEVEQ